MSKIREYRDYKVLVRVVRESELIVSARTPEQAEQEAEALVAEGEQGQEQSQDVEVLECYPLDDQADGFK